MSPEILYLSLICACYLSLFVAAVVGAEAMLVMIAIITITGNVIVGKIVTVMGFQMASSACLAVCLFWIGSLLTQYYGIRVARRALWYNFASLTFLTAIGYMTMKLPGSVTPKMDEALTTIFSFMPSVMVGALLSFGASYMFTIFIQRKIQKTHGGDIHWTVQTGLVATANLLDLTIFCSIAYFGQDVNFIELILTTWSMRLAVMLMGLPVILLIRRMYKGNRFPLVKLFEVQPHSKANDAV